MAKRKLPESKPLLQYDQTIPAQMELFQVIGLEDTRYSNTIELYDAIPKYVWNRSPVSGTEPAKSIRREFVFRDRAYKLRITPAMIEDKNGGDRHYFPGVREEHVEDVLRLLAARGQGIFLDQMAGVVFTLYEIQQELIRFGHTYSLDEIKEALIVGKLTSIQVSTADGKTVVFDSLFESIGLRTIDEVTGQKVKAYVRFNPLVTRSILTGEFRQLNLEKAMGLKSVVARQIYKRISHMYTQASIAHPYTILASTIIRDLGLTLYREFRNNIRDIKAGLDELVNADVLLRYDAVEITGEKGRRFKKLTDVKFSLVPTLGFSQEMRVGNARHNKLEQLRQSPPKIKG